MGAPKGNKYSVGNKGGGRKGFYKKEYAELAFKYCLLGATDVDLARNFGVTDRTIDNWKLRHKDFLSALKAGKADADAKVAGSLYNRALGYTHPDVHISSNNIVIDTIKHYPPDTTAAIFWLKNRQPTKWRDKQELDIKSENKIDLGKLSNETLKSLLDDIKD